jgi:hypothetical protein
MEEPYHIKRSTILGNVSALKAVLRSCKYFIRIQIRGDVIRSYGSGSRRPINKYGSGRIRILTGQVNNQK